MAEFMYEDDELSAEQKDALEGLIQMINVAVDASDDININIKIRRNQREHWSDGNWLISFAKQNRGEMPTEGTIE